MGHLFLRTYLVTIALHFETEESVTERYERLEKLRHLAKIYDLTLQEEARPVASALFGETSLIVHLGFEQALVSDVDWYRSPDHPYISAIGHILDNLTCWASVKKMEFIISPGSDPLTGLQVQLDRQTFSINQLPSSICDALETQTIYSFSRR
jgi:3,4-dihydroxy 2-butanone 4-phosphate synthase/GTP cyclohydrolase II